MNMLIFSCMSVLVLCSLGCLKNRYPEAERSASPEAASSEVSWETQHSVVADADRETVWAYHSDVENWARFEGDAVESITLDSPFQAGTIGTTKMPNQEPVRWRLVEVEPPERTVIEMEVPDAVVRTIWTFEALPGERTRLTQQMMVEGPGAEALVPFMEEHFAKNMEEGMERIAEEIARFAADR